MGPKPLRLVPRADTSSYSREAPYIALIIPASVFFLLGLCITLRSIVNRRVTKHGQRSLEFWPWSWLGACVVGPRRLRAHSWEVSVSSPAGPPQDMRQALVPPPPPPPPPSQQQKQLVHEKPPGSTRNLCEIVGADRWRPKNNLSNPSRSNISSNTIDGYNAVVTQQGPSTPTITKPAPTRAKRNEPPERSSRDSSNQGDDMRKTPTRKYGRQLTGPPVLQLPAEFGCSQSSWEIDTQKL